MNAIKTKLLIVILFLFPCIMLVCAEQQITQNDPLISARPVKVAILEFYNMSENPEYQILSKQFPEVIQRELHFYFSTFDSAYVRSFIDALGYEGEQLYDPINAEKLGNNMEADIVIRGSYNVFGDEIQVICEFTPIHPNISPFSFEYTLNKSSALSEMQDLAESLRDEVQTSVQNEVQEDNTQQVIREAKQEAINPQSLEYIVTLYEKQENIDTGSPVNINGIDTIFEAPTPRPPWVDKLPEDDLKLYFIGKAYNQEDYFTALNLALKDVYYKIGDFAATIFSNRLEASDEVILEDNVKREMSSQLMKIFFNNIQDDIFDQSIYTLINSDRQFIVFTLYSINRSTFYSLFNNTIDAYLAQLEQELANIERALAITVDPTERQLLQNQLEDYKNVITLYETDVSNDIASQSSSEGADNQQGYAFISSQEVFRTEQSMLNILRDIKYPDYTVALGLKAGYMQPLANDYFNEIGGALAASLDIRYNPGLLDGLFAAMDITYLYNVLSEQSDINLNSLGISLGPGYAIPLYEDLFSLNLYLLFGTQLTFLNQNDSPPPYDEDFFATFLFKGGLEFEFKLAHHSAISLGSSYQTSFQSDGFQGLNIYASYNYRFGSHPKESQLQLTEWQFAPIFPSQRKLIATEQSPGNIALKNTGEDIINNIQVGFFITGYMDQPTVCMNTIDLNPGEETTIPIHIVFNDNIMNISTDRVVGAKIIIRYEIEDNTYTKEEGLQVNVRNKNALVWEPIQSVCSFVSPDDPGVNRLRSLIETGFEEEVDSDWLNINIKRAIKAFTTLKSLSLEYLPDPNQPFVTGVGEGDSQVVDTIMYPVEFIMQDNRTGDCDDFSVLYASLLESIGIQSGFIVTPSHIFTIMDTGVTPDKASYITEKPDQLIEINGTMWIPIETTFLDKDYGGFLEAWAKGLEEYQQNKDNSQIISVHQGWNDFPPNEAVLAEGTIAMPNFQEANVQFNNTIENYRNDHRSSLDLAETSESSLTPDEKRTLAIQFIQTGAPSQAITLLSTIVDDGDKDFEDHYYLGTAYLMQNNNIDAAIEHFLEAENATVTNPDLDIYLARIYINLAIAYNKKGNTEEQGDYYEKARNINPAIARRYQFLAVE